MGKLKANSIYRGSGICELGVLVRAETVKVGLKNIICKNMIFSTKKHIHMYLNFKTQGHFAGYFIKYTSKFRGYKGDKDHNEGPGEQ